MTRRGAALLTVLWVLAALGTAAALGLSAVRDGAATAEVRIAAIRARWQAEGCLVLFRAALDRALHEGRAEVWRDPTALTPAGCAVVATTPEDGPVYMAAATAEALGRLPGFTPEVVEVVLERRRWRDEIQGLDQLLSLLPLALRDELAAHYAELVGRVVFVPVGWDVTAGEDSNGKGLPILRERWARAGARVAVIRREVW